MSRRPLTLWLDDRDHHALATLQARYQLSTLSETVGVALHTLTQPPEGDSAKEADEAAIRAEISASTALELHACQAELTATRTDLAQIQNDLQQLSEGNSSLALALSDDLAQRHAEVGYRIPLVIASPPQRMELHATSRQLREDAGDLKVKARMFRRKGKAR
jgi:hypothetical protein